MITFVFTGDFCTYQQHMYLTEHTERVLALGAGIRNGGIPKEEYIVRKVDIDSHIQEGSKEERLDEYRQFMDMASFILGMPDMKFSSIMFDEDELMERLKRGERNDKRGAHEKG